MESRLEALRMAESPLEPKSMKMAKNPEAPSRKDVEALIDENMLKAPKNL